MQCEVERIWDHAPHNAFTDLIRFKDRWLCVFREGENHISPDGAIRVLVSDAGREWQPAALITSDDSDLRDPKLSITPQGQLMLCAAEKPHDTTRFSHQSLTWFSDDGIHWSEKHAVGDLGFWLWRVTWHGDRAYGVAYRTGKGVKRSVRLYQSDDGRTFETLLDTLYDEGYPNESAMVFEGDTALCLLRHDGVPVNGLLGTAQPPYLDWQWRDLGVRIGGPALLRLPDGRYVAAVRLYDERARTSLCWLDTEAGTLSEFLELPSGGDTSYAGMVFHEQQLWVSYYSSHEEKTAIYLARATLPDA